MYERYARVRDDRGLTDAEVGRRTGISKSTFSDWKRGKSTPKADKLFRIAQVLGVTPEFLTGMTDLRFVSGGTKNTPSITVPVVGDVAAGYPVFAREEILDYEELDARYFQAGQFFGLRIAGDSMEPDIHKGDVVIVRKQEDADTGDICVVKVNGERATCKRIKKTEDGLMLISVNPNYLPMVFSAEQIAQLPVSIIGKVVELRRKF
jgi:repressor LexA